MKKRWILLIGSILTLLVILGVVLGFIFSGQKSYSAPKPQEVRYQIKGKKIGQNDSVKYVAIGDSLSAGFNLKSGVNTKGDIDSGETSMGVSYPDFVVNFLQFIQKKKVSSYRNFSLPNTTLEDWNNILTTDIFTTRYTSPTMDLALFLEKNNPDHKLNNYKSPNYIDNTSLEKIKLFVRDANLITISLGMIDFLKSIPLKDVLSAYTQQKDNTALLKKHLFFALSKANEKIQTSYVNFVQKIQTLNPYANINIISYPYPLLKYSDFFNQIFKKIFNLENAYNYVFDSLNSTLKKVAQETQTNYINVFNQTFWKNHADVLSNNFSLDITPNFKGSKKIGQEIAAKIAMPEEFHAIKNKYLESAETSPNYWENYKKYNPFATQEYFFSDYDSNIKQIDFPESNESLIRNVIYGVKSDEEENFKASFANELNFDSRPKIDGVLSLVMQYFLSGNGSPGVNVAKNSGALDKYLFLAKGLSGAYSLIKNSLPPQYLEKITDYLIPIHLIYYKDAAKLWTTLLTHNGLFDKILEKFEANIANVSVENIKRETLTNVLISSVFNTETLHIVIKNLALLEPNPNYKILLAAFVKTFLSKAILNNLNFIKDKNKQIFKDLLNHAWGETSNNFQTEYLEDFFFRFLSNTLLKTEIQKTKNFPQLVSTIAKISNTRLTDLLWSFIVRWTKNKGNWEGFVDAVVDLLIDESSPGAPKNKAALKAVIVKIVSKVEDISLFKNLIISAIQQLESEENIQQLLNKTTNAKAFLFKVVNLENPQILKSIFELFSLKEIKAEEYYTLLEAFVLKNLIKNNPLSNAGISSYLPQTVSAFSFVYSIGNSVINSTISESRLLTSFIEATQMHKLTQKEIDKAKRFLHMTLDKMLLENDYFEAFWTGNLSSIIFNLIKDRIIPQSATLNKDNIDALLREIFIKNKFLNRLAIDLIFVVINAAQNSDKKQKYADFYAQLIKEVIKYVRENIPLIISSVFNSQNIKEIFNQNVEEFIKDKKLINLVYTKFSSKIAKKIERDITDTEFYKLANKTLISPIEERVDQKLSPKQILALFTQSLELFIKEVVNNLMILVLDFIVKNEYIGAKLLFDTWEELNYMSTSVLTDIIQELQPQESTRLASLSLPQQSSTTPPPLPQKLIFKMIAYIKETAAESNKYENKFKDILDRFFTNVVYKKWLDPQINKLRKGFQAKLEEAKLKEIVNRALKITVNFENIHDLFWILTNTFFQTKFDKNESLNTFVSNYLRELSTKISKWIDKISLTLKEDEVLGASFAQFVKSFTGSWFLYDKEKLYQTITNAVFGSNKFGVYESAKHKNWISLFVEKVILEISEKNIFVGDNYLLINNGAIESLNLTLKIQHFAELLKTYVFKEVIEHHLSRLIGTVVKNDTIREFNSQKFELLI